MKLCLLPITDCEHYVSIIRYDFLRIYDSSPKNQDEIQPKNQDFGNPQATAYFDIQVHKTDLNQGLCQKKLSFSITILNVTLLKLGILEWANGKGQEVTGILLILRWQR